MNPSDEQSRPQEGTNGAALHEPNDALEQSDGSVTPDRVQHKSSSTPSASDNIYAFKRELESAKLITKADMIGDGIIHRFHVEGDRKGLLQGLQEHVGAAPSEEQLDQLSQVIMRSQRSFKELIDSFDDPACAVSLDGTVRTVNKRVTELTGLPFTDLVNHKIYDFIEEPVREDVERGLGRFLEKKRWAGTVRLRLKNNPRPLYFECVINGIVKGDEMVGASVLGTG